MVLYLIRNYLINVVNYKMGGGVEYEWLVVSY
nr:MAG TPA: hypothetical protein [Caudoviricetes sp.]DAS32670.1 MAG TPA: hypothetical protein [Caudoviricetes sp.]